MDEITKQERVRVDDLRQILEAQKNRCALSGDILTPQDCTLDHKIPLSRGGEHSINNAQLVTMVVNRAKGAMTNDEFVLLCKKVSEAAGSKVLPGRVGVCG